MFCIKCGVELADSEKFCPLCKTVVYHPEITPENALPLYPSYVQPKRRMNRTAVMILITMLYASLLVELVICDLLLGGGVTWSFYTTSGMLLVYLVGLLPCWFKKPNPVIFVPTSFAAIAAFLCAVNLFTHGNWFWSFAFPATGILALIVSAVVALTRYIRRGHLYIYGGATIAMGVYSALLELFIHLTFAVNHTHYWSIYSLITAFIAGMALIIIAISNPIRKSLEKRFFI